MYACIMKLHLSFVLRWVDTIYAYLKHNRFPHRPTSDPSIHKYTPLLSRRGDHSSNMAAGRNRSAGPGYRECHLVVATRPHSFCAGRSTSRLLLHWSPHVHTSNLLTQHSPLLYLRLGHSRRGRGCRGGPSVSHDVLPWRPIILSHCPAVAARQSLSLSE